MDRPDHPHLRSVPTEEVDAPPVIQMGPQVAATPQRVAPVVGLGSMPEPTGAGVMAPITTHLLAMGGTAVTGAAVGFLSSGELRGAGIGVGVQLTLLGVAGAAFGGQRMPSWLRVLYGVLGLGSAAGAGYLVWTRR